MVKSNNATYYEFQQCGNYKFNVITTQFVCPILFPIATMMGFILLSNIFKPVDFSKIMLLMMIISVIVGIVFAIRDMVKLKGVFLYEKHMEIVQAFAYYSLRTIKFKNIAYKDVDCVEYVGNFYSDPKSSPPSRHNYLHNFIGGNTKDCIKITLKDGSCGFVSVENCEEFLTDIQAKMEQIS